jgi:aminoglycoside/choline kinase family phosphotransferase
VISSSDREAVRRAFLSEAGLGEARREPLPGDASTRRYERLYTPSGPTLMLMDQSPSAESPPCGGDWDDARRLAAGWNATARLSAGRIDAFAATAAYLRRRGLSAPDVKALDAPNGLAVLEDLGEDVFARRLEHGGDEREMYGAAIEVLAELHAERPPAMLEGYGVSWPLLDYDALALTAGVNLFVEWYPKFDPSVNVSPEARAEWDALWAPIAAAGAAGACVFTHRDYHAENLIWLPERMGAARVGLIDFQDALRAHESWDLHSLLQDARRDVSPELERIMLDRYLAQRSDLDAEAFLQSYAALAAVNVTRILGVFARLIIRDGKPRYQQFMPRMWRYLERDLQTPGLEGLNAWFARHAPCSFREAA